MSCWLPVVGRCWRFDWSITFNSWLKSGGLLTKLYFLWWFFIVKLMKLWAPIDSILTDQLCIDKSIIFRTCQRNHEITNYVSMLQFAVEFFWSLIGIFSEILLLPIYFCWWKLSEFHSKLVLIIWKRNCICYESVRFVVYNAAVSDLAKYISVRIILFFMNTSLLKTSRIY